LHALGENERIWFSSDIVRPRAIARTRGGMVRRGQPGKISDRASAELACYDSCLNIRNDFREEVWQPAMET